MNKGQHEPFREWEIDKAHQSLRLDKFLAEQLSEEVSRSQIQQWIRDGHVTINGASGKANARLNAADHVQLQMPEPEAVDIQPEELPLDVIYEDADVIVINKPRGMVVHPAPGHNSGTVVNALLHHCKDLSGINGELRPGIVHRIDKDTSGLIMAAKNDKAHAGLSEQLKQHQVERKYLAVVHGVPSHLQGTVDAPIGRDRQDRKMFAVTEHNSKEAITHFVVLEKFANAALLELKLETGRTHQIRVHMKFIGHPLVGDPMYGRSRGITMNGQALHAAVLGFEHPRTGRKLKFDAEPPQDFQQLLHRLRSQ